MFTQCPKCQSVFMVSEKDIRAHEGLVRCGNCYSVFNSSWNLTEDPRVNFLEEPLKPATNDPVDLGSGFTFNLLSNQPGTASIAEDGEEVAEQATAAASRDVEQAGGDDAERDEEVLEPFPEPDESINTLSPIPESEEKDTELLYFDTGMNDEPEEELLTADSSAVEIEDLTILQTPSFTSRDSAGSQDNADEMKSGSPEPGFTEAEQAESQLNEPAAGDDEKELSSLTEEDMWPGSDLEKESEDDFELPPISLDEAAEMAPSKPSNGEDLPDLSELSDTDLLDDEPLVDESFDEAGNGVVFDVPDGDLEDLMHIQEEEWEAAAKASEPEEEESEFLLPPLRASSAEEADEPVEHSSSDVLPESLRRASSGDDTLVVPGEETATGEHYSMESLPASADEAFSSNLPDDEVDDLPEDAEVAEDDASVFITSDEEEIDEAYVPITLKAGDKGDLFHDLDDFPEPGELSELNYEDTMQINAMLEAANISKEQLDSAMSAAEIDIDENSTDDLEEIVIEGDVPGSFTENVFSASPTQQRDSQEAENRKDEQDKKGKQDKKGRQRESVAKEMPGSSVIARLTNLLPLRFGLKKTLQEPAILDAEETQLDAEETQLIRSLHRRQNKIELPEWLEKSSMIAAIGLLSISLLGQVGYFYMDKLVRVPTLQPLLEAGCMVAGCEVPAVQNIKDIEQLSSTMTAIDGSAGGLKVSAIMASRSMKPQPYPALELTLTDRAGNMISRRVIPAKKYLPEALTTTMMESNEAVDINVRFRTPSIRVDGFELRPVKQNWLDAKK